MKITVHYLAQLKRLAGRASETVEMAGPATLAALLRELARGRHEAWANLLLEQEGKSLAGLLMFAGEEQVRQPAHHELRDGDQITLLIPMAGG